jgi:ParB family chromosome partitioning protein
VTATVTGKRKNFAELAGAGPMEITGSARPSRVPLHRVAPNPLNPRDDLGDVSDLAESMRKVGQLQAATVVSLGAYLAVHPEQAEAVGDVDYVTVMGSRRRLAAAMAGLSSLDIMIKDELAVDAVTLLKAATLENIDRRNFDPIEEGRAIQRMVEEVGTGTAVAEQFGKTPGWVSQRLSLLKLAPEMQRLVRSGEVPVRDARRLAGLPHDEQLARWRAEQEALRALDTQPPAGTPVGSTVDSGAGRPRPKYVSLTTVSPDLKGQVQARAKAMGVDVRELVEEALTTWLASHPTSVDGKR